MGTTYRHEQILSETAAALSHPDNLQNMCHLRWCGEPLPSQQAVADIIDTCRALLFPGFFGESGVSRYNISYRTGILVERLYQRLTEQIAAGLCLALDCETSIDLPAVNAEAEQIASRFIARMPALRHILGTDVRATYVGDPAAVSEAEVIYCYPAVRAVTNYRVAHELTLAGVPVIPRMIAEQAHRETGIDIHPAASIGESFTIDHGTGVVIGATAILGRNVKLYQGVTLGAKSFDTDADGNPVKGIPRHPIIGNDVIIYSNASILGRIHIGDGAIIGGNIWVTEDVAPGEKLIQAKANNILRLKQQ